MSETPNDYLSILIKTSLIVLIIGVLAFGILVFYTGLWSPLFTVSSGSMSPNINEGDLVITVDPQKADVSGTQRVVTYKQGKKINYTTFGGPGDVIIFESNGDGLVVMHRAMFWTEKGEDWTKKAKSLNINATLDSCDAYASCPAPHDGFITKGDANRKFDQSSSLTGPVKPEWILSKVVYVIPYGNYLRVGLVLLLAGISLYIWKSPSEDT